MVQNGNLPPHAKAFFFPSSHYSQVQPFDNRSLMQTGERVRETCRTGGRGALNFQCLYECRKGSLEISLAICNSSQSRLEPERHHLLR